MRKLATIQEVSEISDIWRNGECASNIVLLRFSSVSWQCVAKRGEFSVGDLCIYIEVSTVLPKHKAFSFMEKWGYKVKTVKIWGKLSQGLVLPLSTLKSFDWNIDLGTLKEGDDVTEILGVKRIEDSLPPKLVGEQAGVFPTHLLPKTDEDRIQSYPHLLNEIYGKRVVATYKFDGTSFSVLKSHDGEMLVCSRNFIMREGNNVYWTIAKKYDFNQILTNFPHLRFQGEIVGEGIQGNPLGISGQELYVFNIIDGKTNVPFNYFQIEKFCNDNNLKFAPMFYMWESFDIRNPQILIDMLSGEKYPFTNSTLEGIVVRPVEPFFSAEIGKWFSFKVINNDYLIKKGE